jgi:nucleoside-diphosphate kinase
MGATNPANAAPGSIRALFGVDIQTNSVHGSDSPQSAVREARFFFGEGA